MTTTLTDPPAQLPGPELAPLRDRFDDVRRIAVLRGGGLGDLLFAMPAVEALAACYPDAEITLLGTPLHKALLEGRPGPVGSVELLPPARGVHGADDDSDPLATGAFHDRMRARRFDLAVQLHGGGRYSNPFLLALGARHTVGTMTGDAAPLERTIPYLYYQHEVVRWLETVAQAGAAPVTMEPVVRVLDDERRRGAELLGAGSGNGSTRGVVVVHPGATDPRRRWPAESFAALARRALNDDHRVVVVGDASDVPTAERIVALAGGERMRDRLVSLAGTLTLPELVGVLATADVLVGNDSGPRHLAQAVGTPTVSVYWVGNLINGGPLTRREHRVHLSWTTACPVCGQDSRQPGWTAKRCEHDDSFVAEVEVGPVFDDVRQVLALGRRG